MTDQWLALGSMYVDDSIVVGGGWLTVNTPIEWQLVLLCGLSALGEWQVAAL